MIRGVRWRVADIDDAILAARDRREEALKAGELSVAQFQQKWIDRLLDVRPFHEINEAESLIKDG